jgi:hypothetical protein
MMSGDKRKWVNWSKDQEQEILSEATRLHFRNPTWKKTQLIREAQKIFPIEKQRSLKTICWKTKFKWFSDGIDAVVEKGSRTAAVSPHLQWVVAAGSLFAGPDEEREIISPVICLPCLNIKDIKVEKSPLISASAFTHPPTPAQKTKPKQVIMGVPVTSLRSISPASPLKKTPEKGQIVLPQQNGVATTSDLKDLESKSTPKSEPNLTTQSESTLDKDLARWMKMASGRYSSMAVQKSNRGHKWGFRMNQMAVGLEVMAQGVEQTKEIFRYFVGALFEMVDVSRSIRDLDLLKYILDNSVYLDVLAEVANFETNGKSMSVNFQGYYDDKYLAFIEGSPKS